MAGRVGIWLVIVDSLLSARLGMWDRSSMGRLRRRSYRRGDLGFTLIELLIIMAILGILAAIVVFAVLNAGHESATASCQSSFKTVESAAEAYKGEVGTYPSTLGALALTTTGLQQQTVGPWLKDTPDTYAPGASPAITNDAPYGFAIDPATDSIAVGTIKANGARASSGTPLVDGVANCSDA